MERNQEILQAINEYLMTKYNYKTFPANFGLTDETISARRKKFDLYFRLIKKGGGFWDAETFVIARIGFHAEQKGHGSELLLFLSQLAFSNGFKFVGIEQANVKSSRFAEKFGFKPYQDNKNYIIPIEQLINHFQTK